MSDQREAERQSYIDRRIEWLKAHWTEFVPMTIGCKDRLWMNLPLSEHRAECIGNTDPSKCLCPCHDSAAVGSDKATTP